uniref:50S ribosomal protein L3 n=1 Tax=candidate division CPR3 bacterium TaxID=2268181 RepID=A0A7C4R3J4_UNCC3
MSKYLLGKKIGMTSVINENGILTPVTVLEIKPIFVTQVKKSDGKDGYNAIQVGTKEAKKLNKSETGHLKSTGKLLKIIKEFRVKEEDIGDKKPGDIVDLSSFEKGEKVKVSGSIKAKGFSGAVKRWGFHGGPGGHGHPQERRVGSIGAGYPQHVFKGKKMPGRKGPERKTILNLEIIDIDNSNNLLLLKGSVPGPRGRLLEIRG